MHMVFPAAVPALMMLSRAVAVEHEEQRDAEKHDKERDKFSKHKKARERPRAGRVARYC